MLATTPKYNAAKLYAQNVYIYTEASPNPNSMKFVLNQMLSEDETFSRDYADANSCKDSPLATTIFTFPFVRRVFMTKNFITITKDETIDWEDIVSGMKFFLKEYIEGGKAIMETDGNTTQQPISQNTHNETDSATVKQIKDILEEYIRPAVEGDGGAISFNSFDEAEGVVKVVLQGSCSGCPSSKITLKAGIENLFKRMMPDKVKTVEAVEL